MTARTRTVIRFLQLTKRPIPRLRKANRSKTEAIPSIAVETKRLYGDEDQESPQPRGFFCVPEWPGPESRAWRVPLEFYLAVNMLIQRLGISFIAGTDLVDNRFPLSEGCNMPLYKGFRVLDAAFAGIGRDCR